MSSSLNWFDGDSKDALQQMVERNCPFLVYIGSDNEEIIEVFKDPNIIQLLNNELIICFKMNPTSSSFEKFKEIFNDVVIPSIYLLEKNNVEQFIVKKQDLKDFHKIQLDLKRQMLKAIQSVIKNILDTIDVVETKQKYVQYLSVLSNKLQELDDTHIKRDIPKVTKKIKKSNDTAKIKIKIPCKDITLVQEFQSISSLDEVKTFVMNNVNLPEGTVKFIAHRQFVDEDFCQSLEALELCPSSTIYVHLVPSDEWRKPSIFNFQSWLSSVFYFSITVPYNFLQHYVTSFFHAENVTPPTNKKKPDYKPNSNIHQLRNNKHDDDENNTYNGNSTQQL